MEAGVRGLSAHRDRFPGGATVLLEADAGTCDQAHSPDTHDPERIPMRVDRSGDALLRKRLFDAL
jgi:hypothetical protein